MAKNIEIKAYLNDLAAVIEIAKSLATQPSEVLKQEDVFFNCENGRLKLRKFSAEHGELIFYLRNNQSGPKSSEYFISSTNEPALLQLVLQKAHGVAGTVIKTRTLFITGRTRIHIDQVEQLGNFIELEVVLDDGEAMEIGIDEANQLMEQLNIKQTDLIECAYIDLLVSQSTSKTGINNEQSA